MEHHTQVRIFEGESRTVVAAGKRYNEIGAAVIDYVLVWKQFNLRSNTSIFEGQINGSSLHIEFLKSGTMDYYKEEMVLLKDEENFSTYTDHNGEISEIFLSYAISKNLTNSLHLDFNDDSKSFAVFYVSCGKYTITKSRLLFSDYGIAIAIN